MLIYLKRLFEFHILLFDAFSLILIGVLLKVFIVFSFNINLMQTYSESIVPYN
jgi:hypothetical protein